MVEHQDTSLHDHDEVLLKQASLLLYYIPVDMNNMNFPILLQFLLSSCMFVVQTHPNNAISRITKGRKEREDEEFNEVRYKYLRPRVLANNFH